MLKNFFGSIIPDQNQLIYKIAKTRLAKRTINTFIILILSFVFRLILYAVLSLFIVFNNLYVDFFVQCGISIVLYMCNNHIQWITEHFSEDLYQITRYMINNYSEENFKKWKNYVVGSLLGASFLYFSLVDINSQILQIYILQYALCFFFFDVKDNESNPIRKMITFNVKEEEQKKKEIEKENAKEKVYLINRDDPNTDFVIVEKTKILPKEMLNQKNNNAKEEMKKSHSGFDIIE
jgi:hypothetical protein